MKKIFLALFLFGFGLSTYSQIIQSTDGLTPTGDYDENQQRRGSTKSTSNKNIINYDAKIEQYLIISPERDTTHVDTSLTIKKEYKWNYLRRDVFGLLKFNNVGQTYNTLIYNLDNEKLMPLFGARARHFNYMEIEDINYYHVPTPFTELYYKSAFEQGQQVDAFFTVNTSKQFNFSVAYKGLRSLGKYQHILTSTGNFRFTSSYDSKDKRYSANGHIVIQDLLNQENGGIRDDNIIYFESGNPDFKDRGVFDVNFENAENILKGKRFHLDHTYKLIQEKDSISNSSLKVGNVISFEDKYYEFNQSAATEYFGDAFQASNLRDRATLEDFHLGAYAEYRNELLGDLRFQAGMDDFNYGYDKLVILNEEVITNRLKGKVYNIGGGYTNKIGRFNIKGDFGLNVAGDFDGNFITGQATLNIIDDILLSAKINHSSKAPNYNFLLYQSSYKNYNWRNNFNNVKTQNLQFGILSQKWAEVLVDISTITDYAYYKKEETSDLVKPFQNNSTIGYLKVQLNKDVKLGKFGIDNSIVYQTIEDGSQVFNAPEFVTRNTVYYQNHFFRNALFLQTGVTFNYFTEYYMNAYDPLLAEFYVQTDRKFGGFPMFDFFIDAKVRTARIYFKAEHFNSAWTGYDYYSAPNYPYRDFILRFGIVWNFFL